MCKGGGGNFAGPGGESWPPTLSFAGAKDEDGATPACGWGKGNPDDALSVGGKIWREFSSTRAFPQGRKAMLILSHLRHE